MQQECKELDMTGYKNNFKVSYLPCDQMKTPKSCTELKGVLIKLLKLLRTAKREDVCLAILQMII